MLNAWDLQQFVGGSNASIDIVAHSRGGLVTRWWCEQFDPQADRCKNAILVGSPLAGTGLAAPPNIRKTLQLLTSYGNAISGATKLTSAAVPIMGLVSTLLSVVTSVTSLAAKNTAGRRIVSNDPRPARSISDRQQSRASGTASFQCQSRSIRGDSIQLRIRRHWLAILEVL